MSAGDKGLKSVVIYGKRYGSTDPNADLVLRPPGNLGRDALRASLGDHHQQEKCPPEVARRQT